MKSILFIIVLLVSIGCLHAQQTFPADSTSSTQDTIVKQDPYGMFSMFNGNPGKAALYSLVLPGAGQLYNKRYWKVPIAIGAEAAAIYFLIKSTQTYNQWDACWKGLANETGCLEFGLEANDIATAKRVRDQARSNKDNQWLIFLGVHLIVTADAFIDRHLIEFDVSDDLSMKLSEESLGLGLVYTF